MKKNEKAITLIALIITIIVLLILAGIVLAMVVGDNGILSKAQTAKEETSYQQAYEEIKLVILEVQTEAISKGRTANLKDIIEELKKDSRYEYIINKEPIARLSQEGDYETVEAFENDPVDKIYVIHKGYEFEIGNDLKIQGKEDINKRNNSKFIIKPK